MKSPTACQLLGLPAYQHPSLQASGPPSHRSKSMNNQFTVYFAGSLFNHKDLTGNALLAQYIQKCSWDRYRCYLPQDVEQHQTSARKIRNELIAKLIECDLGLFNFDGTELDAGTVAEFMLSKFIDIPAVILRSDFRTCGEKEIGSDDWNFMCSFYPRTQIVRLNAILSYQDALKESQSREEAVDRYYHHVAGLVVESLDSVRKETPLLKNDRKRLDILYQWAMTFPGGGIDELISDKNHGDRIIAAKVQKGIA
jgi:hypothetical protein